MIGLILTFLVVLSGAWSPHFRRLPTRQHQHARRLEARQSQQFWVNDGPLTRETAPLAVVMAQLQAIREHDLPHAYSLFSRARRLAIEESAKRDMREQNVPSERVYARLEEMVSAPTSSPGAHLFRVAVLCALIAPPRCSRRS